MFVKEEMTIADLRDRTWCCEDFWKRFDESGKSEEALEAAIFTLLGGDEGEIPTLTAVNDLLRFDGDDGQESILDMI